MGGNAFLFVAELGFLFRVDNLLVLCSLFCLFCFVMAAGRNAAR
jgi:hypothetical protein